jgi:hypothetical protein
MTRTCAALLLGMALGVLVPAAVAFIAVSLFDLPIKDLRQ